MNVNYYSNYYINIGKLSADINIYTVNLRRSLVAIIANWTAIIKLQIMKEL